MRPTKPRARWHSSPDALRHAAQRVPIPAWGALAATCLGQFMVVLDATIVNVALPSMRRGLHLDATELQWIVNAYLLTLGGLILLGGRLGDHFGRKRVYLIGGAIFSFASLIGGLAPSAGVLLGARAVQGVGAALLAPGSLSLLTSVYTEARARTRSLAVWNATAAAGGTLGIFLGGALADALGWRSVLFVNVPLGLLIVVLGIAALPADDRRERAPGPLDVPGALGVTAALTALVFGVVETETYGWSSARTLITLGLAVVLFALTAVIESRATNALIPFTIVRRGPIATVIAMMLIHGAVMTSAIYFVSLFLQQVRGYSPFMAGVLMLPFGLVVLVMPLLAARLTSQYGPRVVALATPPVAIVALLWLSRWNVHDNVVVGVVLPTMVLGVGVALYFFALTVMLTSTVEREHSGLGSGLFNASRQVGGSIGLAALVVLAAGRTASMAHPKSVGAATSAGYSFALVISAGMLALGMLIVACHVGRSYWTRAHVRPAAGGCLPAGSASARPVE